VRAASQFCRPLKRARILGTPENPRLKPGATVLMPASPAVLKICKLPDGRNIFAGEGGVRSEGATVFTQALPAIRAFPNDGANDLTSMLPLYRRAIRSATRSAGEAGVRSEGATVFMQALPAIRAFRNDGANDLTSMLPLYRRAICSPTRSAGEAGVRSVAPGFSRGFTAYPQSRKPALAGGRKTSPEAIP
jgi:hypothetical protein